MICARGAFQLSSRTFRVRNELKNGKKKLLKYFLTVFSSGFHVSKEDGRRSRKRSFFNMPAARREKKKKLQFVKKRIVDQNRILNKINFPFSNFVSFIPALVFQNTVSYSS